MPLFRMGSGASTYNSRSERISRYCTSDGAEDEVEEEEEVGEIDSDATLSR